MHASSAERPRFDVSFHSGQTGATAASLATPTVSLPSLKGPAREPIHTLAAKGSRPLCPNVARGTTPSSRHRRYHLHRHRRLATTPRPDRLPRPRVSTPLALVIVNDRLSQRKSRQGSSLHLPRSKAREGRHSALSRRGIDHPLTRKHGPRSQSSMIPNSNSRLNSPSCLHLH